MTEVIPNLYIGNWHDAHNHLSDMYVVTCAHDSPVTGNIKFGFIDGPGNDEEGFILLQEAARAVEDAFTSGKKVLVHCHGGRSRSAIVMIAALMKLMNLNICQAYDLLIRVHDIVRIHPYLSQYLMELEK